MQVSDKGLIALISHEGIVPGPYYDSVGVLTAYIGHTKAAGPPDPATLPWGMPSDLDKAIKEAFRVFKQDIKKYEAEVIKAFKKPLTQNEFDAAVSFHYNTGKIHSAAWVRTFNSGNRAAAIEQIMNWTKPIEVTARRQAEQTLFSLGIYPKTSLTVWQVSPSRKVIWKPAKVLTTEEALKLLEDETPLSVKEGEKKTTTVTPTPTPASVLPLILSSLFKFLGGRK